MIQRDLTRIIVKRINKNKAVILIGARQVGKTTLVKHIAEESDLSWTYWNCDEPDIRQFLNNPSSTQLKQYIGSKELLIVDEAQRIENIGLTSKLIVDQIPGVQLIITGSSSLEITSKLNEPLTGRKFEFNLYPFSFSELAGEFSLIEEKRALEHRLIYGYYPDVVNHPGEEQEILTELISSYLFKDLLSLGNIRKPYILDKLVKAIALQLGNEVSYNELSSTVGVDKNTISKYIDLLEKAFVIFSLKSFCRNMRQELKRSRKLYFWDTGIRNAIINNFNPLELRVDKGALWENFIISERMKYLSNKQERLGSYFWRTTQHQEIDYIEEGAGKIHAYEIKWNPKAKFKKPKKFMEAYSDSTFQMINNENFIDFIM